jgi:UDP-N-acetylglucosamine acyltransferase
VIKEKVRIDNERLVLAQIDERAIVHPRAKIAENVKIGPWTLIDADVEIAEGTEIASHVVIRGRTSIGKNNQIYQFCSIGEAPQDTNYQGQETRVEIGDNNIIREYCSINRGTTTGVGTTRIGDNNFIMAYVHIAHDCQIGNFVTLVNNAAFGGHVKVADYARIGGFVGVHQRCSIGAHSLITASMISQDIPPYVIVTGNTAKLCGLNIVGLKRRGFSAEAITGLRRAYNILFRKGLNVTQAMQELELLVIDYPEVKLFIDSVNNSTRGILRNGEFEAPEEF